MSRTSMSEVAAERGLIPELALPAPQKITTWWCSVDGVWRAWYEGDGDPETGIEMGHGDNVQEAVDELVALFPRPGAECPDCFVMTPFGKSHCASCEGTGAQLPTIQ